MFRKRVQGLYQKSEKKRSLMSMDLQEFYALKMVQMMWSEHSAGLIDDRRSTPGKDERKAESLTSFHANAHYRAFSSHFLLISIRFLPVFHTRELCEAQIRHLWPFPTRKIMFLLHRKKIMRKREEKEKLKREKKARKGENESEKKSRRKD